MALATTTAVSFRSLAMAMAKATNAFLPTPPPKPPTAFSLPFLLLSPMKPLLRSTRRLPLAPFVFSDAAAAAIDWDEPDAGEDASLQEVGYDVATLGEEEEGGEGEGEVGGDYMEPPEEAKVYIGNLPFDMDSERLAQLFEQAGVVEVAEVIYNRETDQSRGFGFVTMSTAEEAEKAIEMFNGYDISGRLLNVNRAAPKGSRVDRPPRQFAPAFRVYVGNLPWQVDDSRLVQLFSEHGKVVDAMVIRDRETGRSRGFGFVTMAAKQELDNAIATLDGQSLDGRTLRVNVAEQRPQRGF